MPKLKLVFYVEDEAKNIIGEKKQMFLEASEEKLRGADAADAEARKKADDMIGDCYANRISYGRNKFVREMFEAAGVIIAKSLDRDISQSFGCDYAAALDKDFVEQGRAKQKEKLGIK